MGNFIADSATIIDTKYDNDVRIYKNTYICESEIKERCSIGDDTSIVRVKMGKSVIINRRSYINDSIIADYSYAGINTTINCAKIGKFCSIGRNVDIGGFNHDYKNISTMPTFRIEQMFSDNKRLSANGMEDGEYCTIGNDVWIAAGVNILHDVTIGDGAVVGAGSVVTKDVPPYAIVVGNPAKILKFRFEEKYISELMKIKWWNWPENILKDNIMWLVDEKMTDLAIEKMHEVEKFVDLAKEY